MRLAERPGWPSLAGPLLLLALILGVSASPAGAAEAPAPDKKEEAKPKVTFPPDVEAKFVKFLAKVKEAKGGYNLFNLHNRRTLLSLKLGGHAGKVSEH